MHKLIQVAVGRPVRGLFTYRVPDELAHLVRPGHRVVVPFGRGRAVGFVLDHLADTAISPTKLRNLTEILDTEPVFDADLLQFLQWTASYYRHPLGEVLRAALPPGLTQLKAAPAPRPSGSRRIFLTEQGRQAARPRGAVMNAILDYLAAVPGESADLEELVAAVPRLHRPLEQLIERGLCAAQVESPTPTEAEQAFAAHPQPPEPTREQAQALQALVPAVQARKYAPFLLHGVTGSGKTEVYLRAIAQAMSEQCGALVLVPEIALTPQLVGRFRARFGDQVAALHSGLSDRERLMQWRRLKNGEARLAVGVRSAIFVPVVNLGLIIVDEEHDGSFKQEEKLRYHARDLAVVRARLSSCPVILGSATPSLETLHNARSGRYRLLRLHQRVDDRPMPEVSIIDMRLVTGPGHVSAAFPQLAGKAKLRAAQMAAESSAVYGDNGQGDDAGHDRRHDRHQHRNLQASIKLDIAVGAEEIESEWLASHASPLLSPPLMDAIGQVLQRKQQAILFLNRRGQSTYHLCLSCGNSLKCVNCAVSLTLHGNRRGLMCHYCGYQQPLPEQCPLCSGPIESLGMGTERVEEELAKHFPQARICRLDRDSATDAPEVTALLSGFAKGDRDILIGTQMVAKGHDFPGVTLVGVLLADLALNLPDFRAAERTFQLLAQVAGRAGRGKEPGRVLVQTYNPQAAAIAQVVGHNYLGFAEHEIALRKAYHYPPHCRMLAVRIDGDHPAKTAQAAQAVARAVAAIAHASSERLRILGPSPAPFSRLKGKTRWQLLVKGPTVSSLAKVAQAVEELAPQLAGGARASVDVDPVSLL